jgi:hypothetical protein
MQGRCSTALTSALLQLVVIGDNFANVAGSGGISGGLRSTVQQKSREYVDNFQKESVELLKQMLEGEVRRAHCPCAAARAHPAGLQMWHRLPLPPLFDLKNIPELRMVQTRGGHMTLARAREFSSDMDITYQAFLRGENVFAIERDEEAHSGERPDEAAGSGRRQRREDR